MKYLKDTFVLAMVVLVTMLVTIALHDAYGQEPVREARANADDCTEYSRDGSYCFLQPLESDRRAD